jgi:hypothetical protein
MSAIESRRGPRWLLLSGAAIALFVGFATGSYHLAPLWLVLTAYTGGILFANGWVQWVFETRIAPQVAHRAANDLLDEHEKGFLAAADYLDAQEHRATAFMLREHAKRRAIARELMQPNVRGGSP